MKWLRNIYLCMHKLIYIHTKSPEWPTENIFQSQPSKIKLGKKIEVMRSSASQWGIKARALWCAEMAEETEPKILVFNQGNDLEQLDRPTVI